MKTIPKLGLITFIAIGLCIGFLIAMNLIVEQMLVTGN